MPVLLKAPTRPPGNCHRLVAVHPAGATAWGTSVPRYLGSAVLRDVHD